MQVNTSLYNNSLYIRMDGELDQSVANDVRTQLDAAIDSNRFRNLIFDMSCLSFMDSTGVGILLGRYKKLHHKNIPVFFSAPNRQIDKIIRVSGLYTVIPLL